MKDDPNYPKNKRVNLEYYAEDELDDFGVDDYSISLGSKQDGSRAALPVWARFMREAYKVLDLNHSDFIRPDNVKTVEICFESKMNLSKLCPVEKEIFIDGTQPVEICKVH